MSRRRVGELVPPAPRAAAFPRVLRRKMLRDLWQIRWRALAVVLTIAVGVGVHGGIWMAIGTGFLTRDVLFTRMAFADLEVQFLPEDVANLPDLTRVPGVRTVERRLVLPGTVLLPGGRRMTAVLVCLEQSPTLNLLEIAAGRPIRAGDLESAVVDRALVEFHGFKVGDRIRVQVGEKTYDSRIDGVAVSPEYLITVANPDYFVPERGAIGAVFTDIARISDALGFTMVNDLLIGFEAGVDRRAVTDAVVARVTRLNVERVIPREQHFMWKYVQLVMESFQLYVPAIDLTLGGLSFLLTLITINRLVSNQRREIGALLALGYRRSQVLGLYLRTGVILGVAGGAVGTGLSFVFRTVFAGTFASAVNSPEYVLLTLPRLLATTFAIAVLGTALATALPVWQMLRLPPTAIVREPVREGLAQRAWVQRALASIPGLPVPIRFGIRNVARRPGRAASTIAAIGLSLAVAIAYIVSLRSAMGTPELVFGREGWDVAVDFLYPVPLEDLAPIRSLAGAGAVEPYFRRFAEIGAGERSEPARILGIEHGSAMQRPLLRAGRFLGGGADEIVIGQDLARRLAVGVGDPVTITIRQGRAFVFHVVGVSGDRVPGQIAMPLSAAQAATEFDDEATGVFITAAPAAIPALVAALERIDYVAKVTTKQSVAAALRGLMSDMLKIVYVAVVVSVFVAALFIVMSVNFVISERQGEYAILKCLGYQRGRLGVTILAQALGEAGLAALLSIPLGIGLALYLNAQLTRAWYEVIAIIWPRDIAQVLVLALALIPACLYPGLRMLDRLDIVAALASRRIE